MKTSPSHRIKLKVRANARPLNANEAIRGSPSPWKVLIMMPTQAAESDKRLHASAPERVGAMTLQKTIKLSSKSQANAYNASAIAAETLRVK